MVNEFLRDVAAFAADWWVKHLTEKTGAEGGGAPNISGPAAATKKKKSLSRGKRPAPASPGNGTFDKIVDCTCEFFSMKRTTVLGGANAGKNGRLTAARATIVHLAWKLASMPQTEVARKLNLKKSSGWWLSSKILNDKSDETKKRLEIISRAVLDKGVVSAE